MYFKNSSEGCTVVLMTEKGKITIKPGEVVDIKHKIFAPVSRHIVKATEEEYLTFREKTQGTIQAIIEQETTIGADIIRDDSKVGTESKETTAVEEGTITTVPEGNEENTDPESTEEESQEETEEEETKEETEEVVQTEATSNDFLNGIKSLLTKGILETPTKEEEKVEEQTLLVTETTNDNEITALEEQLETLKQSWVEATKVKTKDKIAKQIKEVQKQIDKIKKHQDLVEKQN